MSQELQGDAKAERVVLNGVDSLMCRLTSETANLSVTATTKDDDAAGRNHEQTQVRFTVHFLEMVSKPSFLSDFRLLQFASGAVKRLVKSPPS